jgi:hypothetical protein
MKIEYLNKTFTKRLSLIFSITVIAFLSFSLKIPKSSDGPAVSIHFKLQRAGFVTLVIDDADGKRVRNLVSESWYSAGENLITWDGKDDLGRYIATGNESQNAVTGNFVRPGNYVVKGLVRGAITPEYLFSPYTTGDPPWPTSDHKGGWLANHTPPMSALFVPENQSPTGKPAVYLGCFVTEGPDGLAWVDLDGRKQGGKRWVGGNWTAAPYLARDAGKDAVSTYYAYVASVWETQKGSGKYELRITALTKDKDVEILTQDLNSTKEDGKYTTQIGGIAVNDGIIVISLPLTNRLMFVNGKEKRVLKEISLNAPKGSAFDNAGNLFVLSGKKLLRFNNINNLSNPVTVTDQLSDPVAITLDNNENIYVSDHGTSHQVKVFSASGKFLRAIGKPGVPKAGPYEPLHMNNPAGITIDSRQHLWVAENDFLPKRVSVWTLDGQLLNSFYGPSKYGGGGTLDANDTTRYYYSDSNNGAMEFKLNWNTGTSTLKQVYYRPSDNDLALPKNNHAPETAFDFHGQQYFTNAYNNSSTKGAQIAMLFINKNGIAQPTAAMGNASTWDIFNSGEFKSLFPAANPGSKTADSQTFFIWSDLNGDFKLQKEEVAFAKASSGGITVMPDLSFCISRLNGKTIKYIPQTVDQNGVPKYDINKGQVLANNVIAPASTGGDQVLADAMGWVTLSLGTGNSTAYSINGIKNGDLKWSYPNLWPGLHASHKSPKDVTTGEIIGPTRFLGNYIDLKIPGIEKLWAINGNNGNIYLFTADGMFVATILKDFRLGKNWAVPVSRGSSVDQFTFGAENFWPNLVQTKNGSVYITGGRQGAILRLKGIQDIQRLPDIPITIKGGMAQQSQFSTARLVQAQGVNINKKQLNVSLNETPIVVDGKLDDWKSAQWATIEDNISGAVMATSRKIYVAYKTGNADLLNNSGASPNTLFKTGGALDVMISSNDKAKPNREKPVIGDYRLIVSMVKGKPRATLYEAVSDVKKSVSFTSPVGSVTFDYVQDVSKDIELASSGNGNYEISVPVDLFGLKLHNGLTVKGDIGVLIGDGDETTQRIYWSNKATANTSDTPSEATLTPRMWGNFIFVKKPD